MAPRYALTVITGALDQKVVVSFCFSFNNLQEKESSIVFLRELETVFRSSDETDASISHALSRIPGIIRRFQSSPADCKALLFSLADTYCTLQVRFPVVQL